jgi:hypothetical protein
LEFGHWDLGFPAEGGHVVFLVADDVQKNILNIFPKTNV